MSELQSKSEAELRAELARIRREAQELATKIRLGQVKTVHTARVLRKDIARILTLLKMKA